MNPDFIFGREHELQSLAKRLAARRPLLVYGPTGVGKTLLITAVLRGLPDFLYSPDSTTINAVFRSIAQRLWDLRAAPLVKSFGKPGANAIKTKSALNLKGVLRDALHDGKYCLVLDHIRRPSYSFAATVRELMGWCNTPVITIARSAHMEDTGFLQALYPDRADRFELKNFDAETAEHFALEAARRSGLSAQNMSDFVERVLEYSQGNPGAIVAMLDMAKHPQYRSHDRIKITPLYIDFRLNWKPAGMR
jgi:DNA polymerase III delta prime subunit